jgi:hypothetical protein
VFAGTIGTITSALNINPGVAVTGINLNNNSLIGVNHITINDPGPNEGIQWLGGNGWQIYESPNDLTTNSGGNLQFVTGSTRRATFNTSGQLELPVATGTAPLVITSTTRVANLDAATAGAVINTVTGTGSVELVRGNMADNDQARILVGGTASNAGFLEIATADDGSEPIHVRQYSGAFATLVRTATILDGSGNTSFPGVATASRLTSTVATGTAPLTVTSTTRVANLNVATAGTADTLTTARTIGGVSFNGSANINLPGVNTAGNQNTSGTAAVSTAATVTTSATASAFKVPFANTTVSTTGNYGLLQDSEATFTYNPSTNTLVAGTFSGALSGNATTATTLATTRAINGVNFNGSAAITVPGNFADRTTNESGHAVFISTTATGNQAMFTNTTYRFNPSTSELSATNFNSTSDLNKKKDIETIADALNTVKRLRGVTFNWKDTERPGIGVIAQEVELHLPQVVVETDGGSKTVQYGNMVGLLIEAIKEQQQQIDRLTKIVETSLK